MEFHLTINILSYTSTNVTTGAYVTLVSSTPSFSKVQITDTSGKILKIAIGAVGSEVDICSCPVSGTIVVPVYVPAGSRLSIRAIDASATTGYNITSFL